MLGMNCAILPSLYFKLDIITKSPHTKVMGNINWSWLGGFVDGEGCLRTLYRPSKRYIACSFWITNTNLNTLELIKSFLNCGSIRLKSPAKGNRKAIYDFSIQNNTELSNMLIKLIPHLLVKKEQAVELLKITSRKSHSPITKKELTIVTHISVPRSPRI